jgi:hypothetical protein
LGSYLGACSVSIVALALVAQISGFGNAFLGFSIGIFPVLIFLGLGTWNRLIQLGISDAFLIQAINRIRRFYANVAPEAAPFFSYPAYDDLSSIRSVAMPINIGFEGFGSAGLQVAVINSVLIGAFAAILAASLLNFSPTAAFVVSIVAFILGLVSQFAISAAASIKIVKNMDFCFPNPQGFEGEG